jgi:hydroperoxy fatty acid reductase
MSIFQNQSLVKLNGDALDPSLTNSSVVLIVNVASRCGFTKQYEEMVRLQSDFKDHDFLVLGVPCNQFGKQEPGTPEEIQEFCATTYGVNFPLLQKQDVNGSERSPLYDSLIGTGPDIVWNFEKFLVDRNGQVIKRFGPRISPTDSQIVTEINQAL